MLQVVTLDGSDLTKQREAASRAALLKVADPECQVPLSRLKLVHGGGFTESFASGGNIVVKSFNGRPVEDRAKIYKDFTSRYGVAMEQGFKELLKGLDLPQFSADVSMIVLRNYFINYRVPMANEGIVVMRTIELIAAS